MSNVGGKTAKCRKHSARQPMSKKCWKGNLSIIFFNKTVWKAPPIELLKQMKVYLQWRTWLIKYNIRKQTRQTKKKQNHNVQGLGETIKKPRDKRKS